MRDRDILTRRDAARAAAAAAALVLFAASPPTMALPSEPQFAAPVTNPFGLGGAGFRVSLADIVGPLIVPDGALDALGGNGTRLTLLANSGSATVPMFTPAGDGFDGLVGDDLGVAVGDLDGDDLPDILVGNSAGDLLYANWFAFLSVGTPVANPFGLANVGSYAVPTLADLDADGDLDALVGNGLGALLFFRNTGSATAPAFAPPVTNPFGLAPAGGFLAPALGDLDGDGDLDALVGAGSGDSTFFRNIGSATAPAFAAPATNPFGLTAVGNYSAPALADVDGDGDLDALIVDGNNGDAVLFRNDGVRAPRVFPVAASDFVPPPGVGRDAGPALADIDADGDLDAFVGNLYGDLVFYRNGGSATAPALEPGVNNPFGLANVGSFAVPAIGDLDRDGDLDVLVGLRDGSTLLFENVGTVIAPSFRAPPGVARPSNPFGLADVGDFAAPALVDLDADADHDVVIGAGDGQVMVFLNNGSPFSDEPLFVAMGSLGLVTAGQRVVPRFADLDGDGDLDAVVGNADGDTAFFRNTGSATEPAFAAEGSNPLGLANVGTNAAPALADLDRDGDLDALIGAGDGTVTLFLGGPAPPAPTPTASSTPTATRMHTRTRTATASPTRPFGDTATATATPTLTPTAACAGDCDGSGTVLIAELITEVNIALGNQASSACPSGDTNGDGTITVSELIVAVTRAIGGCGG